MAEDRPLRACDVCGGVDDHPRHIMAVPPGYPGSVPPAEIIRAAMANGASDEAVDALLEPTTVIRHMDCCASRGCATCAEAVRESRGARGTKLLAHIQTGR